MIEVQNSPNIIDETLYFVRKQKNGKWSLGLSCGFWAGTLGLIWTYGDTLCTLQFLFFQLNSRMQRSGLHSKYWFLHLKIDRAKGTRIYKQHSLTRSCLDLDIYWCATGSCIATTRVVHKTAASKLLKDKQLGCA